MGEIYKLELMILKKLGKEKSRVSRKELYKEAGEMYYADHGIFPAESNFSRSLRDLVYLGMIEVGFDMENLQRRYFKLTDKGELYLRSSNIYHKGLLASLINYEEFYPKYVGKFVDLEDLKMLNKINFDDKSLHKIAKSIKKKRENEKSQKEDKISLPALGYLSLHATSKLRNRARKDGKEISYRKFSNSSEALESLANDEIAMIPSLPVTTLRDWMENEGKLDNIGDRTFLELCNYIILDENAYNFIKRDEKKAEIYSTASSPVREAIARNIGKEYVVDKDSAKMFRENAGSGVCFVTENPAIACALSDYGRVIGYLEPSCFLINHNLCDEDPRDIKAELNNRNMVTQLNIHRSLTNPNTFPILDSLLEEAIGTKED